MDGAALGVLVGRVPAELGTAALGRALAVDEAVDEAEDEAPAELLGNAGAGAEFEVTGGIEFVTGGAKVLLKPTLGSAEVTALLCVGDAGAVDDSAVDDSAVTASELVGLVTWESSGEPLGPPAQATSTSAARQARYNSRKAPHFM